MRGIEMLILRIGIPFACIGLLNSDKGAFGTYIKEFVQNAFTVIVQLALVNFSILLMANGHVIYAIAFSIVALRTPQTLSKFLSINNHSGSAIAKTSQLLHIGYMLKGR